MKRKIFALVLSVCIILLTGCFQGNNQISSSADVLVASGLKDMVNKADYIVVGTYTGLDKKINSARDPQDISKEDPDHYSETHVYSFQIDEVLKGEILHPSIQINKAYQIKMNDSNGSKFLIKEPYYYKPNPKKKYLLFLVKAPENTYSAGFINYEISFDSTGIATLSKPDQNLKEQQVQVGDKNLSFHQEVAEAPDDITGKSFSDIKSEIPKLLKGQNH